MTHAKAVCNRNAERLELARQHPLHYADHAAPAQYLRKDLELGPRQGVPEVVQLQPEPRVRPVRAEAGDGLGEGRPRPRRSRCLEAGPLDPPALSEEQAKQLKVVLSRHWVGGKIMPYSDSFQSARTEFNKLAGTDLAEQPFWHAILKSQGPKRQPPKRKKVAVSKPDDDDEE